MTRDVPDYALVKGNPARRTGWMSRHGHVLRASPDGTFRCPESGMRYEVDASGQLHCLDLEEEVPLPPQLSRGSKPYRDFDR